MAPVYRMDQEPALTSQENVEGNRPGGEGGVCVCRGPPYNNNIISPPPPVYVPALTLYSHGTAAAHPGKPAPSSGARVGISMWTW